MTHEEPTIAIVKVFESTGRLGTIHVLLPGDTSSMLNNINTKCDRFELTPKLESYFKDLKPRGARRAEFRRQLGYFYIAGYLGNEMPKEIPHLNTIGKTRKEWYALCALIHSRTMFKSNTSRKTA